MRLHIYALAGASLFAFAGPATALEPPTSAPAVEDATLGEIVVTARRRAESLQEVPQTVNAVTGDTLQKLQITQFSDIQAVVPGLNLSQGSDGYDAAASLRGVTFDDRTQALPTVAMYMNDAPVQPLFLFDSLFDVGQIEVLRGPQGTTRGVAAPSGAITVTTHKPDLSEFGGYLTVSLTDLQGRNLQGALNAPIIKDVLAVRFAGLLDQTDYDGVRSLHSALRPRQVTTSERTSVSFEPSDILNANITYAHMDKRLQAFDQVSGPGQGTGRDPAIDPFDRIAVEDGASDIRSHQDIVVAHLDSRLFGQHLSYVGSYQHSYYRTEEPADQGDVIPLVELYKNTASFKRETTQEVRLASDPAPGRRFDYTVGAYYDWQQNGGSIQQPGPLLSGAFGSPASGVSFTSFNPAYQVPIDINLPYAIQETSIFGSITLHFGDRTELSGGVRHIWSIVRNDITLRTGDGLIALPPGAIGLASCSAAGFASTYSGFCDIPIPGGVDVGDNINKTSETPNIYNLSLSHHFTRDVLGYVTTGTSYRPPVASTGLQGALASLTDPSFTFHPSERSRAYEVGIKSTFLGGRARLNAALFRQRFHNLTLYVPNVLYNNTAVNGGTPTLFAFTDSVDALVQGFDLDGALQITRDWNVSLQASYADGKIEGGAVPCNITGADGAPVFNTQGLISLCPGGSASRLPLWNATVQSEYSHPVGASAEAFLRGLLTYYPENKNRVEPDFTVASYSLLNLYAGVRSQDGAWELSVFARNALGVQRVLDRSPVAYDATTQLGQSFAQLIPSAGSGYYATQVTPQREVGVNLRYAWGSR